MARDEGGRPNQRLRTRKDLLEAALRLSSEGRQPSLEEVAEEAMVSRATAYRYFPNVDALLAEASLHLAFPDVDALLDGMGCDDPAARVKRLDGATSAMIAANETALRTMLASASTSGGASSDVPTRQNRRSPAIHAALEPCRELFDAGEYQMLERALCLVIGTEAMLVFKDVLRLPDEEATRVRHWVIEALVEKARRPR